MIESKTCPHDSGLVVYGPSVECRVESVEFATAHETNDKETAAANSTLYTLH